MPPLPDPTSAQRAEQEREELLCVALASIGDAVIATDPQGRITTLNKIAEELTGWTKADAVGQSLESVFHVVDALSRRPVENPARRALRDGVILGLVNSTILIARDGTQRSISDSVVPIYSESGKIDGYVLLFRDVTEQRRLEKENVLQGRQERFLGAIVTSSDDAIISKSLDGIIQSWNAAAERIFGYTEQQAVGRHISILIPPERITEEDHIIARLRTGERVEHFETIRLRKDGESVFVSLTVSPIRDAKGRIIGASKIARDISEQRRTQDALRKHEQQFRTLVEQVEDYAIFMTDIGGRATSWNEGVLRVLGFTEEEFIGHDIVSLIFLTDDINQGVPQAELEVAAATGRTSHDRWMKRKDGTQFWAAGVTTGLRDRDGELLGFIKVMRDQTRQKEMEIELREVAMELAEADRRKDEFLATLAHELRNPLAPIRTGLEAMKLFRHDPAQVDEIRSTMERQSHQMVRLIDDLLELSRISQGKLELRKRPVALADVIKIAVETAQPIIDEAGHELILTLPATPIQLDIDPHRMAQVFSNLLNNAAKYTPDGGRITLSAELHGNNVAIKVKDNGIGIPADKLEHVFEMFSQIKHPLEEGYTGLGIGLTLVKSLVEMHDGEIHVDSPPEGQGSEFTVLLPLNLNGQETILPEPAGEHSTSTRRYRVLIVDDNKAAAEMLGLVVKMLGHEIQIAGDGEQGIEIASTFAPDIVLMDIGMPKMNGFEAARFIRQQPWGKQMMLVALTGWGQDDDRRRTCEAGFDHHLVKPAELTDLQQLFREIDAHGT